MFKTIAARAATLAERLAGEVDIDNTPDLIAARFTRWQTALGGDEALARRLAWADLSREGAEAALGAAVWPETKPLPAWTTLLTAAFDLAGQVAQHPPETRAQALPFEHLWLPFVWAARQQLAAQHPHLITVLETRFIAKAATVFEGYLLAWLSRMGTPALSQLFDQRRLQAQPWRMFLRPGERRTPDQPPETALYSTFVGEILADMPAFYAQYSTLARLLSTVSQAWVATTAEILAAIDADWPELASETNKISRVAIGASDPHNHGRSVAIFRFEDGKGWVYKPRPLTIEAAFQGLFTWANSHKFPITMLGPRLLQRERYGWAEFMDHTPCQDSAEVTRHYERTGVLLAALYALVGLDFHYENIIAHGEYPVAIDLEALMVAEVRVPEWQNIASKALHTFNQHTGRSVLAVGMLPEPNRHPEATYSETSALSGGDPIAAKTTQKRWQFTNTDDMVQVEQPAEEERVSRVGVAGVAQNPAAHREAILRGFREFYRFLLRQQATLLGLNSPLLPFRKSNTRFIARRTSNYFDLLLSGQRLDYMGEGVERSLHLELAARAYTSGKQKPITFPVLAAELEALERFDIPCFVANPGQNQIWEADKPLLANLFAETGYVSCLRHLANFSQDDLQTQCNYIEAALLMDAARQSDAGTGLPARLYPAAEAVAAPYDFVEEATAIAEKLARLAVPFGEGINWAKIDYKPGWFSFEPACHQLDLYDGLAGIALFFATLANVSGQSKWRDFALQTLAYPRARLAEPDSELTKMGIGGASGLGSLVYGLSTVGRLLGEDELYAEAGHAASLISQEAIDLDDVLDIVGGSAGALLAILALWRQRPSASLLAQAVACGQHLRYCQDTMPEGGMAWRTSVSDHPLTGFSHGASGMAYALFRLAEASGDDSFAQAAHNALAYEAAVFMAEINNWPDYRVPPGAGQNPSTMNAWCHGATGIGLARLAMPQTPMVQADLQAALATASNDPLAIVDHICCGNAGRANFLSEAGHRLGRPDLSASGHHIFAQMVKRARADGGYTLLADLPPTIWNAGLFQGAAGIGYSLLSAARPGLLPNFLLWD
jgi:type 2 lantibiotic biosynthesis protein LanM